MTLPMKQGDIWLANLNPSRGTEVGKLRPVLIIQSQALLDIQHPSTVVIPLSTKLIDDTAPLRIRIPAQQKLQKDSDLLIDQIRAIDNRRLISGPIAHCKNTLMQKIFGAICEVTGMDDFY